MTHHDTDAETPMNNRPADEHVDTTTEAPEVAVADTNRVTTAIGRTDSAPELLETNKNPAGQNTMDSETTLFPADDVARYRDEWRAVQAGFVDDPRSAVRDADKLLEQVVDEFTSRLADRRTALSAGDGHETEDLRQALRSYRSLFDQLIGA